MIPISPWVGTPHERPGVKEEVMGVEDEEEDVEDGRAPRIQKPPGNRSTEELRVHSLTHIPYHPGCRCCVAGRKREHTHPLRDSGHIRKHADLVAANGTSVCADYFFPKDKPGDSGASALAVCDTESQFLAGHVVDAKGASADHATVQVLRGFRKMGHYGHLRVNTDQESSIADLIRAVAKERGDARTVLEHAARSDCKHGMDRLRSPFSP